MLKIKNIAIKIKIDVIPFLQSFAFEQLICKFAPKLILFVALTMIVPRLLPTFAVLFFFGIPCLLCQELFVFDKEASCTFDSQHVARLIKNDSLYEATILLNDALAFTKKYDYPKCEAKAYNALGMVFSEMGNDKNAQMYYGKALHIYDSVRDFRGKDYVLSNLASSYLDKNSGKKFDSIYHLAQSSSVNLNSELFFLNLEIRIKHNYHTNQNTNLLVLANFGLESLRKTDFSNLNYSRDFIPENLKQHFQLSFTYHKAIALIKLNRFEEGFDLLFSIDDEQFENNIIADKNSHRQLATFNYYKYRYFEEFANKPDSAITYLLKSDTYKYQALRAYEKRNLRNGELTYKIIQTEEKLNSSNKLREKDTKISQSFLVLTIISSVLLISVIIFCFYYYRTKKNIEKINYDLKASNQKLIKQDKERLEFFSILSHELRTPIYGISGLATLIEQEHDEEKKKSYLDSLISSSNYISILIDNVLQATRLKFENKKLRPKPGRIDQIVQSVLSTVKVAAENKGLQLKCNIEPSDENEYILIDKVAFSQVLINLAYNGIRYTKDGYVAINVNVVDRTATNITLRFEVEDSGIGIKDEHRQTVFNAFENKQFLQKNSSGSGLGLYIVKTILASHNTKIDFVSKPNVGSKFFFTVNLELCEKPNVNPSAENSELPIQNHILVVDDNKINLLITKKNVERIKGCSCETASNGREALSMVKKKDYDMVLMDINMPDMDGFEVTRHIRLFNPNIPILALTALNSAEIGRKATMSGMNAIITKPYVFENFRDIIRQYSRVIKQITETY